MALLDGLRDRMRRQRPVGAAEEMQGNMAADLMSSTAGVFDGINRQFGINPRQGGGTGYRSEPNQLQESDIERMQRGWSAEENDAFMLGQHMGAQSLLELSGESVPGGESGGRIMTKERLNSATNTLLRYRGSKSSVNRRIVAAQEWWKMNNWEQIRQRYGQEGFSNNPKPSGWLWNSIVGKHADAIDSYPEPVILPRMADDQEEAKKLSAIIPVVMEMVQFESTYSDCAWQKMQEGTGAYGVFWDSSKLGGLGDIDIKKVNMLNLYWEPGIRNIQDSRNVFYVSYVDVTELEEQYPDLKGKALGAKLFIDQYKTDDTISMENKAVVIDWYYKKWNGTKKVLHYCKYVGENCLYSSEEEAQTDPMMAEGWYQDGNYPFVLDPLFPVEGSPAGYGYIDIGAGAQTGADLLDDAILMNTLMHAMPRYFERKDASINRKEFLNWRIPIVTAGSSLGADALRAIEVPEMGAGPYNMLQQKIDEVKFITGNTDVNNGGVPSGVTAASAIAALKEDSGRSSKDSTKAAYRSYREIVNMVIERIRQFYDIPRVFRIMGADGQEEFTSYDNTGLKMQTIANMPGQQPGLRLPVFDIDVRAQRENAYTKMSQNELGIQFWQMGMFNPQATDQAIMLLDMMDFKGKDELKKKIQAQGTMQETMLKIAQIAMALAQKYNPVVAEEIGMVLQGVSQDANVQIGGGGGTQKNLAPEDASEAPHDARENALVRRSAERAANASRPE